MSSHRHDSPPTALFHNADIAMYRAKSSRTGTAIAYRMDHAIHVQATSGTASSPVPTTRAHQGELIAARRLLPRDRAVLADWQKREHRALAGEGWHPPQPLAVGAAAHELVQRAEAAAG